MILGRPFLATSYAVIRCRNGLLTLAFRNLIVQFNVFHSSNQSIAMDDLEEVNMIESLIGNFFEGSSYSDPLEKCVTLFGQDFDEERYIEEVNAILDLTPMMNTSQWAKNFESLIVSEFSMFYQLSSHAI